MNAKEKRSYNINILMTIGVLGTLASIFNIFNPNDIDWYMILIGLISSVSLIYGAQQLKSNQNPPKQ